MTRQGWAARKVNTACNKFLKTYPIKPWTHYAAQALLAEHKRAVRVVKAEYDRSWKKEYVNEAYREGRLNALADVLAALKKGRT